MPDWFLPYTAAALVAAALGWLAFNYDPDADSATATPTLAGAPAPGKPASQQAPAPAPNAGNAPDPAGQGGAPAAPAPDPAPAGDEAAVRRVVTASMKSDRAADCTRFHTQALLEQMTGGVGAEAIDKCRDEADGDAPAEFVRFEQLRRDGAGYFVRIATRGGEMGNTTYSLSVIPSGGTWKLDRLLDIELDLQSQLPQMRESIADEDMPAADVDCFIDSILKIGEEPYERAYLEGRIDEMGDVVGRKAVDCLNVATLRSKFEEGIRSGTPPDIPQPIVECTIDMVYAMSAAELRALIKAGNDAGYQFGARAAEDCARSLGYVS